MLLKVLFCNLPLCTSIPVFNPFLFQNSFNIVRYFAFQNFLIQPYYNRLLMPVYYQLAILIRIIAKKTLGTHFMLAIDRLGSKESDLSRCRIKLIQSLETSALIVCDPVVTVTTMPWHGFRLQAPAHKWRCGKEPEGNNCTQMPL